MRTVSKSNKIARLVGGLFFFVILIISSTHYQKYKAVIAKDKPINYSVVKVYNNSGRGRSYFMDVVFDGRPYKVSITERIAHGIAANKYPAVYYVKKYDKLITVWTAIYCGRFIMLAIVVVIICCIPFEKIFAKGNVKTT